MSPTPLKKMASSMQDKVVLSYYDSLLRESDVALLTGANWINDKIIGFYFELDTTLYEHFCNVMQFSSEQSRAANCHYSHLLCFCRYLGQELFSDSRDRVCLITPDVTQFIKIYNGIKISITVVIKVLICRS